MTQPSQEQLKAFVDELSGFAIDAEKTLEFIESNMEANKGEFSKFSTTMFTIKGTAHQLNLPDVAHIATLGEEIALKATSAQSRPQIRKCIGTLWDALTTVKYLLENFEDETHLEQKLLINRLEHTLKSFGGARPTVSDNEIDDLLKNRKPH
ncbi:MAG: hypothetical protein CL678_18975 [Bdellovibrionaceae bacterium]|nr:hypothetical protein [Pseudobdellovibrionaceae bacterium]|tara:strand:+ start:3418 stop:3873 length:456 start_codon:yes stop_codon:yes gene_type:complete